jgi:hypothetical protein
MSTDSEIVIHRRFVAIIFFIGAIFGFALGLIVAALSCSGLSL